MNILLTGASGLVGSAFARLAAERGHTVTGIVGRFNGPVAGVTEQLAVDLADPRSAREELRRVRTEAIVNCAAMASPAACDVEPEIAEALNVALPRTLAELAREQSARLIHLSSEQVFDGRKRTPFATSEAPNPINLYGRQKLASERAVHETARELAVTLRPPLLLGNSISGTRSVHEALLALWSAGKTATLFADEFRQPCTADNLAEVMLLLSERRDIAGVFNWAGSELVSRVELATRLRDHFGLSAADAPVTVVTRTPEQIAASGRPACLHLDVAPLVQLLRLTPETLAAQCAQLRVPPAIQPWLVSRSGS